jgi:hypothetical protein
MAKYKWPRVKWTRKSRSEQMSMHDKKSKSERKSNEREKVKMNESQWMRKKVEWAKTDELELKRDNEREKG